MPETVTIALKRSAVANMTIEELRAVAYISKRIFKDLRFPWKRLTLADLSMSIGEGPQYPVKTPGIRFGSLFVHQQNYDPALYAVSHFATGKLLTIVDSLMEAAYVCGALEFGGVPWDLIEDVPGWERVRKLPMADAGLANIRRAFELADDNQPAKHDRMPHARLAALVAQADALRAVLEISQPNQILGLDGIDGGDTTLVVTADGLGGATYEEFTEYDAGPNNRQQTEIIRFETEDAALAYLHTRTEEAAAWPGGGDVEFMAPV